MTRPWEDCEPCGTKDTIPFPNHRTLAEAWGIRDCIPYRIRLANYERRLASRRKPSPDDEGDAA